MALYENVFIARQDMSSSQVETLIGKFSAIIKDNGGAVGKTEYCGLRNLAYPIKKNRKGHYVVLNLTAPATAIAEMERNMKLNEDVMRFLTIHVEEHETGPSAILQHTQRGYSDESPYGESSGPRRRGSRFEATERDAEGAAGIEEEEAEL